MPPPHSTTHPSSSSSFPFPFSITAAVAGGVAVAACAAGGVGDITACISNTLLTLSCFLLRLTIQSTTITPTLLLLLLSCPCEVHRGCDLPALLLAAVLVCRCLSLIPVLLPAVRVLLPHVPAPIPPTVLCPIIFTAVVLSLLIIVVVPADGMGLVLHTHAVVHVLLGCATAMLRLRLLLPHAGLPHHPLFTWFRNTCVAGRAVVGYYACGVVHLAVPSGWWSSAGSGFRCGCHMHPTNTATRRRLLHIGAVDACVLVLLALQLLG